MASKDNDDGKPEADEADVSLDMSQAAVKKMIADARERGYITYEQLNQVMPPEQVSSEQIEDVMSMLSEMGINIVEDEDLEEGGEAPIVGELVDVSGRGGDVAVVHTTTEAMIPFGCICARWAQWSCCRAKARLRLPSGSRLAAIR